MTRKHQNRIFVASHIVIAALLLCFPLYRYLVELLPRELTGCILHDRFFLYCPVCGGTRAIEALMRFDLLTALSYNLFVTLTAIAALAIDILAWVRFFQKRYPLFPIPPAAWIVFASFLVLYFVGRNLLMIVVGFDPTGDLLPFWKYFM